MIVVRLPTTLCVRRDPKFEVRGSQFQNLELRTSNLEPLPVPCFSPFALFSPWEP